MTEAFLSFSSRQVCHAVAVDNRRQGPFKHPLPPNRCMDDTALAPGRHRPCGFLYIYQSSLPIIINLTTYDIVTDTCLCCTEIRDVLANITMRTALRYTLLCMCLALSTRAFAESSGDKACYVYHTSWGGFGSNVFGMP